MEGKKYICRLEFSYSSEGLGDSASGFHTPTDFSKKLLEKINDHYQDMKNSVISLAAELKVNCEFQGQTNNLLLDRVLKLESKHVDLLALQEEASRLLSKELERLRGEVQLLKNNQS